MKKNSALISVIIPVYNVESYLSRCVDSVVRQTYKYLEIILVDDGSTDSSGEMCDTYEKIDDRVKVIHKNNGGLSSARNSGLQIAQGDYIGFVDSDDYIAEDMYEILLAYMFDDVDITCCGNYNVSSNGRRERRYGSERKKYSHEEALEQVLLTGTIGSSACSKLFRRKLFDDIRFPAGRVCEDIPTMYQLFKNAGNVVHTGETKYFYCYRADSISNRKFYFRRIDCVLFRRDICIDVRQSYPNLIMQAEAGYLQEVIGMIGNIQNSDKNQPYDALAMRLKKLLCNMAFRGLNNLYLSKEAKKLLIENWISLTFVKKFCI